MIPIYLFIQDFQAHQKSEINFSLFSSAVILGKRADNDLIANAVGKTSIFRSIEYVLFNQVRDPVLQKEIVLEKLIRDGANKVSVIFDFLVGDETFRVIRSRTRSGVSDLSLFKLRASSSETNSPHTSEMNKAVWEDISSRRTADTEEDLMKKIKSSYKIFIGTTHFMQNDTFGIATATPEKRKTILKNMLNLTIYAKLEEIAKEKATNISKDIEKNRLMIETINQGNYQGKTLEELNKEKEKFEKELQAIINNINNLNKDASAISKEQNSLILKSSVLEKQASSIITKRDTLKNDVLNVNAGIKLYSDKRKYIVSLSKQLSKEIEEDKKIFEQCNFTQQEDINNQKNEIETKIEEKSAITTRLQLLEKELKKLNIPLPLDGTCPHCRQILSEEHRNNCIKDNENSKKEIYAEKHKLEKEFEYINYTLNQLTKSLSMMENDNKSYEKAKLSITNKEKEIEANRKQYDEFVSIIASFSDDLAKKEKELITAEEDVKNSSAFELLKLNDAIDIEKKKLNKKQIEIDRELTEEKLVISSIAVYTDAIKNKKADDERKALLQKSISNLEEDYSIYPIIAQSFSSSGIPNLIIQNVLEDLQIEANNLLSQIHPGLQLAFTTEKVQGNGVTAETLEINYFLHNKERVYSQLSGAQRLCIDFSLKLGLSFLFARMMGSQIKFLLFDEVDQGLDKASTDAFADIIKYFQNDFKILVISHNDRLQEKFGNKILVEQDQEMVSQTRFMIAW
jgi:DNA repair protein SbcC/Rad50